MATQFDATARISVDLRGFSQAANEITRSGGAMTQVFANLHRQLNQIEAVNKKTAAQLQRTASVYTAIARTVQTYASAIQTLNKNESSAAQGAQKMAQAFAALRSSLASVQGMSQREAERIGRTVNLYNQLASALQKVARSYQIIRSVGQTDRQQSAAAERNAQAAARLALEQQRVAVAAQRAANAQARLRSELEGSAGAMGRFGQSSFAARSSLSEIEQQGRLLLQVFQQIGTVLAGSAISQEQAFAQVSRVVGETAAEAAGLQKAFQGIAADFPISFEEVAKIGQLGAQIGISANELEDFTKTVARFSLTTGVAAEQTTLLLGRIAEMQNVPIDQMENLGSAILALGTASAATEEEILRINESIATVGNVFGLSAQAVTGLAAALATLRVRPELARGSLTRVFGEMDAAIQEGGASLKQLSEVMGLTAKEVVNLRNNNPDEFFLAFVKGVRDSAQEAGGFQEVLRGLGINAVRDIDTITRLANNYDVVADSFSQANNEWAKGSELQRQSQGIFDTTAARLQNLSDAFKNFAAQAGTPLAGAIGLVASALSDVLEFLTSLGPVVPIVGSLTALVVAGGAAWVAYQIILSKTIQSMLATRELQRSLGVSTLSLGTAMAVYRRELGATNAVTASTVGSMRGLTTSATSLATSMNAAATANANFARSNTAVAGSSASIAASLRANAAATTAVAAANTNYAVTSSQVAAATVANSAALGRNAAQMSIFSAVQNTAAAANTKFAASTAATAASAAGLNRTSQQLVPTLNAMSASMQRAATAGATMGAGMALTSTRMAQLQASAVGVAGATARVGAASRAAAFAMGPWGIAIGAMALVLGPMIGQMLDFSSAADKIADKAIESAGGMTALTNAIKADTEAFRNGASAYRTVAVAQSDLSQKNRDLASSTLARANAEKKSIELTAGNRAELEKQASAHGKGAEAARLYLGQLDKAESTIKKTNAALAQSSVAIGEQTRQWLTSTAEAAVGASKIADGSDISKEALEQLGTTSVDVGKVLEQSLKDPQAASKTLQKAIDDLQSTADNYDPGGGRTDFGKQINLEASAAQRAQNFLEALQKTIGKTSDESLKASTIQELLGKSLKGAGQEAVVAGGRIKLTADNLEDLDTTADDVAQNVQNIAKSLQGFGTPLTAFQNAAKKAMGDAEGAVNKFSLNARSNLDLFLKELDKIAQAQQNWSANLVKISATLGTDIAQGLADLGPEAAPMIQELANLTTKELEELKPRLAALGQGSAEELAGGLLKGMASLQGVSDKVRSQIATGLSAALKDAASPEEFNKVVTAYDKLAKQISGKKPKIDVEVAVNAAKAGADIDKFLKTISAADKLKIRPEIDVLFDRAKTAADFNRIANIVETLANAKKAKIKIDMDDAPAKASIKELEAWVKLQEVQGLLDAKGKAAMEDKGFRKKVQDLAALVLGEEAAGKFDANGDGKFNDKEFRRLFQALISFVLGNESNLDAEGKAELEDLITKKLGGIIQVMDNFNGKTTTGNAELNDNATPKLQQIRTAMANFNGSSTTAYANVVQTTYRRQVDQGNRGSVQAASGGYISGPGGPRDDKIAAWLSDGEYVVNARATRRHRALLDKINASGRQAASDMPFHYASGGHVAAPMRSQNALMAQAAASLTRAGDSMVNKLNSISDRKVQLPKESVGPVITVNNTYPREEPTSITINRALAYSAALNGTL